MPSLVPVRSRVVTTAVLIAALAGALVSCTTNSGRTASSSAARTPRGPAGGSAYEQGDAQTGRPGAVSSPVSLFTDEPASTEPPPVAGKAYIVVNPRTGKVLAQRNPHQRLPVASTQKLLGALVLLERGNLDETITVASSDTWVEPTMMGIQPGERYRRRDLFEAMVVRSSNDIAKCLARCHSGSEAAFARAMNAKARALGMKNSRFVNAHGLTAAGAYSTAYDLSILARAAMNHSYLHRLTQIQEMDFRFADGRTKHIWNTNRVLFMSPYCEGLKTGYTSAAGRCLVSCGSKGGRKVIAVVLGSKQPDIWTDSMKLLHWGLGVSGPA